MSDVSSLENDVRAIEAINQRDVQFALANDSAKMMSQWTDDIVLLPPAGPIQRGRSVIAEAFREVETPEIVESVLDIQEVKVLGDHALQWGTYRYGMRPRAGGETVRTSGKLMRILQRQQIGCAVRARCEPDVRPERSVLSDRRDDRTGICRGQIRVEQHSALLRAESARLDALRIDVARPGEDRDRLVRRETYSAARPDRKMEDRVEDVYHFDQPAGGHGHSCRRRIQVRGANRVERRHHGRLVGRRVVEPRIGPEERVVPAGEARDPADDELPDDRFGVLRQLERGVRRSSKCNEQRSERNQHRRGRPSYVHAVSNVWAART